MSYGDLYADPNPNRTQNIGAKFKTKKKNTWEPKINIFPKPKQIHVSYMSYIFTYKLKYTRNKEETK